MDAEKPTFVLDLDADYPNVKPLPYRLKKQTGRKFYLKLIDYYPKFEEEFFDVLKDVARYIDRRPDLEERLAYNRRLSRIFISRDRMLLMRLFRELVNATIKEGDSSGQKSNKESGEKAGFKTEGEVNSSSETKAIPSVINQRERW